MKAKKARDYSKSSSSNSKYMGGMSIPGDFGHASKVLHIETMQGPGGKVDPEPCQYSSSYASEAYHYKY